LLLLLAERKITAGRECYVGQKGECEDWRLMFHCHYHGWNQPRWKDQQWWFRVVAVVCRRLAQHRWSPVVGGCGVVCILYINIYKYIYICVYYIWVWWCDFLSSFFFSCCTDRCWGWTERWEIHGFFIYTQWYLYIYICRCLSFGYVVIGKVCD